MHTLNFAFFCFLQAGNTEGIGAKRNAGQIPANSRFSIDNLLTHFDRGAIMLL